MHRRNIDQRHKYTGWCSDINRCTEYSFWSLSMGPTWSKRVLPVEIFAWNQKKPLGLFTIWFGTKKLHCNNPYLMIIRYSKIHRFFIFSFMTGNEICFSRAKSGIEQNHFRIWGTSYGENADEVGLWRSIYCSIAKKRCLCFFQEKKSLDHN